MRVQYALDAATAKRTWTHPTEGMPVAGLITEKASMAQAVKEIAPTRRRIRI